MEENNNLLLIIDAQYDFCNKSGSLYVPGAEKAVSELSRVIREGQFSKIILTQDTHTPSHISFPTAWKERPAEFTTITASDVKCGRYTPLFVCPEVCIDYLTRLENNGRSHTIWPIHCLDGSVGAAFPQELQDALVDWHSRQGEDWVIYRKGQCPEAEMYSAFSYADGREAPSVVELKRLAKLDYDKIYIAGFAKDFCVAHTVKDMMLFKSLKGKLVFLNDCMATINPESSILSVFDYAVSEFGATVE